MNYAQPQYGFAPMMANGGSVANAQSVQSEGRGKDTMLVHMTPKEVGGLQALAMQYGGSLTINPQTGLPEAGFLENILPTLMGAALTIGSGGVINPYMSAAIVGGIQGVRTGDVGQGLLAGLGAFGGAGLGAGLTAAGASTAVPGAVAAPGATAAGGIEFALTPAELAAATGTDVAAAAAVPGATTGTAAASTLTNPTQQALLKSGMSEAQVAANTGGTLAKAPISQAAAAPPIDVFGNPLGVDEMAAQTAAGIPANSASVLAPPSATPPPQTILDRFGQAGRGVENLFTKEGAFKQFVGEAAKDADKEKGVAAVKATGLGGPTAAITKAGLAALPALVDIPEYEEPEKEVSNYKGPYKPSARQVSYPDEEKRRQTSEFTYFNPSNPIPYAEGGETSGLSAVGASISPSEAQVYQNIANVQRLAGIPAIDPSQFAVAPSGGFEQFVYNPIQTGPVGGGVGPEIDYGFAPLMSRAEAEAIDKYNALPEADKLLQERPEFTINKASINRMRSGLDPEGFRSQRELEGSPGLKAGGSVPTLETGGFVLTKKAVDGLGKGSNKKGQANAQRGLGAIPIRGRGTGTSDSIKTSIDKKRPALVSNGEAYVPKKQVAKKGGAKAFYALMKQAEKAADKRRRA